MIDGGTKIPFEPSIGVSGARDGIHARMTSATSLYTAPATTSGATPAPATMSGFDFKFALTFNGSSELTFAPVAQETTVSLTSDWPRSELHRRLPANGPHRRADQILRALAGAAPCPHIPQAWSHFEQGLERIDPYQFGVRFIVPVDFYQLVTRAAKYAMMFLATAFMAVFLLELGSARHVHPVQYLFVGFAMILFYILLLSLAEQIGFLWSYLIAATATSGLISLYVARVQEAP